MIKQKQHKPKKIIFVTLFVVAIAMATTLIVFNEKLEEFPYWHSNLSQDDKFNFAVNNIYSEKRENYNSDAQFANFRAVRGGRLKDNYIYRGASPYLNNERTTYVNKYLYRHNIKNVISISENQDQINKYLQNENISKMYFAKTIKNNELADYALGIDHTNIMNKQDLNIIIKSLRSIINSDGNIYIHCQLGRDRTGAYCAIIEALAGASLEDIINDYMFSFYNYSFISKKDFPEMYQLILNQNFKPVIDAIAGYDVDLNNKNLTLVKECKDLLRNNKLSENDIEQLEKKICN